MMPKLLLAVFTALLLASCSNDSDTALSVSELLEQQLDTNLSSSEVAELLEQADLLCQIDESVLETLWASMSDSELNFQDYVFNQHCSERAEIYQAATGRTLGESLQE